MELRFKLSTLLIPVGWVLTLKQTKKSSESSRTKGMDDNGAESADFISELPDALLLHILSFLDKMAVFRTSVLSRRWSYLWTLVPFPTHTKEMKSSFMELKGYILRRKLHHEEVAREDVSNLVIFIAKIIRTYFLFCLAFLFMLDFNYFTVTNTFCTVGYMQMIYSSWCYHLSYLCDKEADLKKLQEDESRLTSTMNAVFTTIPMVNPLFPQNFQPRYAKSAKLYGLFGMLVFMIISCSVTLLKWKFAFSHVTGGLGVLGLAVFVMNK